MYICKALLIDNLLLLLLNKFFSTKFFRLLYLSSRKLVNRKKTSADEETCDREYGKLEDSALPGQLVAICGSRSRISHLYMSVGHEVKIWVTAGLAPTDLHRFVVHYRSK